MISSKFLGNKCLTLLIWQKDDIREDVRLLIRSLKVKLESSTMPRSLHNETGFRFFPRKSTERSGKRQTFWGTPNNASFVFTELMRREWEQHHCATRLRSAEIWDTPTLMSLSGIDRYNLVSFTWVYFTVLYLLWLNHLCKVPGLK